MMLALLTFVALSVPITPSLILSTISKNEQIIFNKKSILSTATEMEDSTRKKYVKFLGLFPRHLKNCETSKIFNKFVSGERFQLCVKI